MVRLAVVAVPRRQQPISRAVPGVVRGAGFVVAVEGVCGLLVAAVLVMRGLGGADQHVVGGASLAACFGAFGAGVLAAGWALTRGNRWGRGIAIFTNLLLLPVTWYVTVDSHRWGYGILMGAFALVVLAMLGSPVALRWAAGPHRDARDATGP